MILIAGLGNIGPQYADTRHNIGFMAVDRLGEDWRQDNKFNAHLCQTTIENQEVLLVKPTTMMNNSGQAVGKLAQFYQIAPDNIWVVYDELDLPLGRLKIGTGISDNGHNGLISITNRLGHNRYWKFRLGINTRQHREIPGPEFVLQPFTSDEQPALESALDSVEQALRLALASGLEAAMQMYNKTTQAS